MHIFFLKNKKKITFCQNSYKYCNFTTIAYTIAGKKQIIRKTENAMLCAQKYIIIINININKII
jgi:hypothetical protein